MEQARGRRRRRGRRGRPGASRTARSPSSVAIERLWVDATTVRPGIAREHVHEPPHRGGVEVRGRLVEQQHAGLDREERGEGDPLLLAARELERRALEERRRRRTPPPSAPPAPSDVGEPELARAEGDLVRDGRVEEHRVHVLEEERRPRRGTRRRNAGSSSAAGVEPPARVADLARVREGEAVEEPEERGLPAAVHAEHDHPLAGAHLEGDVLEDGAAAGRTATRSTENVGAAAKRHSEPPRAERVRDVAGVARRRGRGASP